MTVSAVARPGSPAGGSIAIQGTTPTGLLTCAISAGLAYTISQAANGSTSGTMPENNPTVVPGAGWSGPTSTPSPVGTYPENMIGRFNCVPYTTLTSSVYRFGIRDNITSIEGVDYIEFASDGGSWVKCYAARANPDTANLAGTVDPATPLGPGSYSNGSIEHWCVVDPSNHADGFHELRARLFPKNGQPIVLSAMYYSTNFNGTLPNLVRYLGTSTSTPVGNDSNNGLDASHPMLTSAAAISSIQTAQGSIDGGTLYLLESDQTFNPPADNQTANNSTRWFTIASAPGANPDNVRIAAVNGNGLFINLSRYRNLTVLTSILTGNGGGSRTPQIWFDHVNIRGPGAYVADAQPNSFNYMYITESSYFDNGQGAVAYDKVRNVLCKNIGGDVFTGSMSVVGWLADTIAIAAPPEIHSDLYQVGGTTQNIVFCDGRATNIDQMQTFQIGSSITDFLVENMNSPAGQWNFGGSGLTLTNFYFKATTVNLIFDYGPGAGGGNTAVDVVFDHCVSTGTPLPHAYTGVTYR